MIRLVVSIKVASEKRDQFLEISKNLVQESRKEDGCIEYSCLESDLNNSFYIIELWRDEESLAKHNETEHFKKYVPVLGSCAENDIVIEKYIK
ncbi:MAG: putative quinol monooxygenase [Cetobacterium sp.]|uniref:putative quinol monooxygenase n=1 Tax=Cetobacterium sp. TaxID=2071632 RepID=UPI003EE54BB1